MPRKKSTTTEAAAVTPKVRKKAATSTAVVPARAARRKKATETLPQPNGQRGKHDLVVVESPTKAKTIGKYLGPHFRVIASSGHVRDLTKRKESWFELTEKALKQMGKAGAPADVIEALKPLVKREFKTKNDLLKAARKYVSKKELEPYERELAKVARQYDEIEGLNIGRGWIPHYVLIERDNKGKDSGRRKSAKEILDEINKEANRSNRVFLATDPDREGESIAWHIQDELKLADSRTFRITFNEITKSAVANALAHAGKIDMNRVQAQEARRFLDRIVGFPLSKLLQRKITRGLSAGRVQSVAVRLIVEREREIEAFKTEEYWKLTALLSPEELRSQIGYQCDPAKTKILAKKKPGEPPPPTPALGATPQAVEEVETPDAPAIPKPPDGAFLAECSKWNGTEFKAGNEQQIDEFVAALKEASWSVAKIEQKDKTEKAPPPFTTSTMQQQANIRLHFTADRTMRTAQRLYEGVELGSEGSAALITYMRTDSTRVSNDALSMVRHHIQESFGPRYLPEQPNIFKSGKSAQEAHEAIRPVDLAYTPQRVQPFLNPDQLRLYTLIYNRFVASQMAPAIDAMTNVEVEAKTASTSAIFKAQGRIEKFDGYRKVMPSAKHDDVSLPPLKEQQPLHKLDLFSSQHFTKPPARYNEASLVKALEKEGIGRPSTYATIIYKIQQVGYVKQMDRRFHATELGKTVTDLLIEHFPAIMDMKFTSHFEEELDQIERKELVHTDVLNEFWGGFSQTLEKVQEEMPKKLAKETGEMCPKCGKPLVERFSGKTKKMFIGCSGWNKEGTGCDYIKPREGEEKVPKLEIDVSCPNCGKPMVQRFGPRGPFLGCSGYPECKTTMRLNAEGKPELTAKSTEHKCEKCGSPMVLRQGRRGPFLACSAYPKCRNALDVDAEGNPIKPKETGIFCEKCKSPMIIKRGPRGPFLACSAYPKCKSYKSLTAELREQLKDILPPPLPKKETPQIEVKETCPECGSAMKVRTSSRGPFLGCSKYPKCKGTRPLPEELLDQIS
ncbi:MAG TPA: type I DNA topoisomerase [Gemmataceae bacterium]|nr:type I DNA topoisomerase [Gemmataceae bacterium]